MAANPAIFIFDDDVEKSKDNGVLADTTRI